MRKVIYKYLLGSIELDEQDFICMMPSHAEILSVGYQGNSICVWAMVDPDDASSEKRLFHVFGTGHKIVSDPGKFLGTVHMAHLGLVFHVFSPDASRDAGRDPVPGYIPEQWT